MAVTIVVMDDRMWLTCCWCWKKFEISGKLAADTRALYARQPGHTADKEVGICDACWALRPNIPEHPRPGAMIDTGLAQRLKRPALVALALYALLLVAATHVPQPPEELVDLAGSDKTLHFAAYAVLALLVGFNLALRGWFRASTVLMVLAGLAVFGALDEITQPLVGRQADVRDWGADVAGVVGGMVVVALLLVGYRYLRRKSERTHR